MKNKLLPAISIPLILMTSPAFASPVEDVINEYALIGKQVDETTSWPDVSKETADKRNAKIIEIKQKLETLPPSPINSEEELSRKLLLWRINIQIEGAKWDEDRIPFDNGDGFFNTANYEAANTIIHNDAEAVAWIKKINTLPDYYDAQIVNMRRGIKTGFVQPKMTAQSVLSILKIAYEQSPEDSPLLAPLNKLPNFISPERQAQLRSQALGVVKSKVKPSQEKLVTFFEKEYVPNAREKIGVSNLKGGREYYEYTVRRYTTTNMTPDEIFNLGQSEVARIRTEMQNEMAVIGFKGSLREFLQKLNNDKQFYAPDLQTYIEKASEVGIRIQGQLPRYFGNLPRNSWTIRLKPPELEASSGGYNLGDPQKGVAGAVVVSRISYKDPLFGLPAWMLHEGVPGHHLQIALGQERYDIPEFRRRDDITAFVEGWALYSERLGEEMGIYRNSYEKFGMLSFDVWRACRLMMDVGIHYKGWSYEKAAQCLYDNTALTDGVIQAETQRYVAWPGQALAYKIGQQQIISERKRAENALGDKFDIRAFHDAVLDDGPMPMSILHEQIGKWIKKQGGK